MVAHIQWTHNIIAEYYIQSGYTTYWQTNIYIVDIPHIGRVTHTVDTPHTGRVTYLQ